MVLRRRRNGPHSHRDNAIMKMYAPKPGYVFNPLLNYPRNKLCFCGSKLKAKNCHLPKLSQTCLAEEEKHLRQYLDYVEGVIPPPIPKARYFNWIFWRIAYSNKRDSEHERTPAFKTKQTWRRVMYGIYWRMD